jgi:hypothetical protein
MHGIGGRLQPSQFQQKNTATGVSTAGNTANVGGIVGGGQIGYNYMLLPNFLVGFESDFSGANINSNAISASGAVQHTFDNEWFGTRYVLDCRRGVGRRQHVPANDEPVAVVLDFMSPTRAGWRSECRSRCARHDKAIRVNATPQHGCRDRLPAMARQLCPQSSRSHNVAGSGRLIPGPNPPLRFRLPVPPWRTPTVAGQSWRSRLGEMSGTFEMIGRVGTGKATRSNRNSRAPVPPNACFAIVESG